MIGASRRGARFPRVDAVGPWTSAAEAKAFVTAALTRLGFVLKPGVAPDDAGVVRLHAVGREVWAAVDFDIVAALLRCGAPGAVSVHPSGLDLQPEPYFQKSRLPGAGEGLMLGGLVSFEGEPLAAAERNPAHGAVARILRTEPAAGFSIPYSTPTLFRARPELEALFRRCLLARSIALAYANAPAAPGAAGSIELRILGNEPFRWVSPPLARADWELVRAGLKRCGVDLASILTVPPDFKG